MPRKNKTKPLPPSKVELTSPLTGKKWIFTHKMAALLGVMTNPETMDRGPTELCALAGVSLDVYYHAQGKADFLEALKDAAMVGVGFAIPRIMRAAIETAIIKGGRGHADRKMLLSAVGIVTDKKEVKDSVTITLEAILADLSGRTASIPALDNDPYLLEHGAKAP